MSPAIYVPLMLISNSSGAVVPGVHVATEVVNIIRINVTVDPSVLL